MRRVIRVLRVLLESMGLMVLTGLLASVVFLVLLASEDPRVRPVQLARPVLTAPRAIPVPPARKGRPVRQARRVWRVRQVQQERRAR